jgi:hypothetical protein
MFGEITRRYTITPQKNKKLLDFTQSNEVYVEYSRFSFNVYLIQSHINFYSINGSLS